jgi:small subunit ribosomal protein S1
MSWTSEEQPLADDTAAQDSETPEAAAQSGDADATALAGSSGSDEAGPRQPRYDEAAPLKSGDIVSGLVVHVDRQGVLVDVGTKSEGLIPYSDLEGERGEPAQELAVGDRINVYVVRTES